MTTDILLVGCGNMGFAMLKGWVCQPGMNFHVVEPSDDLRERAGEAGASVYAAAGEVPGGLSPVLTFLAVKPQVMADVVPQYARLAGGRTTFVSIAAGTTIDTLSSFLPGATPIIRCMPNTPAAIGRGMLVSIAGEHVGEPARTLTERLLATSGETAWIDDESLMDAVTAVSGSGPAYLFHFIECLAEAGVAVGLPPELAGQLALQTVAGAGELAARSDDPPSRLREQVTSPAGTTAAALDIFMSEDSLRSLVTKAVIAARDRGIELGKG